MSTAVPAGIGSSVLGYPRIGPRRELKRALESYWHRRSSRDELLAVGRELQESTWLELAATGLSQVPGNTFSFYDHVLDNALLFGAVPARFRDLQESMHPLDFYFAMARGAEGHPPLELAKFISSNYYYRAPELDQDTVFELNSEALLDEVQRAKQHDVELRPVVLGPLSLLLLSRVSPDASDGFHQLDLLEPLLAAYEQLFEQLARAGITCVQLDEPWFTLERSERELEAFGHAYRELSEAPLRPRLLVTGPYGDFGPALPLLASTKVEAIGLDLVDAPKTADELAAIPGMKRKRLYAGVIDGRNVWRVHKQQTLDYLKELYAAIPDIVVSTSCSLMHVPYDVLMEYDLNENVADHLAFAKQKVGESVALARALRKGPPAKWADEAERPAAVTNDAVRKRVAAVTDADRTRMPFAERRAVQRESMPLPDVPATTLGSFPQTEHIRKARYDLGQGRLTWDEYVAEVHAEIERVIRLQEDIGLDVLVNGEVERNDMVQFFAEQLDGFAITRSGWIQVYGSRTVRPPVLYGDVSRTGPMSVRWAEYAQSLTDKPVKAVITGPVTLLALSYVRDDQPMAATAEQLALAVRDEVADLEAAGIRIIQVDEPAIRTLLPRQDVGREEYLEWAVGAFRLATAGAAPQTQIHTHIGLSRVRSVVEAIENLDCDVTYLIQTRTVDWVLDALGGAGFTRGVGPGVYETRSAVVPDIDELDDRLSRAAEAIDVDRLWANPDGGLKTRHFSQLEPSLRNLVAAARRLRRRADQLEAESALGTGLA
ncbi:5-methyltetrahydropteroyltriglutamate--homocysteine S-methyltransferase [Tomitella fengzijianii]|uniref:5-methyltetrahydropteroyltriglutamate--homocysteine S-methyltransferase n=1 Tax=Tomitella fengzijianii TaxID=2597660 RepID=A0A516X6J3_9ACTN|nr:5-methyltetrahydropteroyltriglutamate--homocysteine S-methyltransferase [Tomitella fengzijianii]QDQ98281.1 5-methyltetrahydropteroyltriglutamate--homocysteine S-methyltransferase [Tomitella fengzijianii]